MFTSFTLRRAEVCTQKTSESDNGCSDNYSKRNQAVPFRVTGLAVGKGIRQQYHGSAVSCQQFSSVPASFFQFINSRAQRHADVDDVVEQRRQLVKSGGRGRTFPRIADGLSGIPFRCEGKKQAHMGNTLAVAARESQSVIGERVTLGGSVRVDRFLSLLRQAMTDCAYTVEALAAALESELGRKVDKGFLWRMLNGERPLPITYLVNLPIDMKVRFTQLSAEALGWTVVRPATPDSAAAHLVAGLLGLLRYDGQMAAGRAGVLQSR